jgi:hypothetical protein
MSVVAGGATNDSAHDVGAADLEEERFGITAVDTSGPGRVAAYVSQHSRRNEPNALVLVPRRVAFTSSQSM